ncbi:SDR family oxidoreductase [Nocardioides sp. zg-ZUI104]|uniref:SDR family oxidoreductase n=1 Tax=Nocardioides faecalis TaxID=2803858 RepID=UPI001BCE11C9|nr:SDR family oxidoreductase [Nocardioides faecalis]MBS4751403.1 SDR family oxidoreductase [Nocardioides faecalis]
MKNVVITGSTKGIGRAMASAFHARGHNVVLTGRDEPALKEAVAELESRGGARALGRTVDVTDPASLDALWEHATGELGRIDIWVNNAGVAHTTHAIVDTPADAVRAMVQTNMYGTIFGSQTAVRGMTAQGGGQLFNVLGGGSDGRIRPNMGVYGATKRGLDMFTKALVKEVEGSGVRVGQIRPGILITDGWLREAAAAPDQVAKQRKVLNILVDHVEDVAPELVDKMLASTKNGDAIAWLTTGRMTKRFMNPGYAKKNDKLARYGL